MADSDGPLETQAYICKSKGASLELGTVTLPALSATQVQIEMEACGLCHTDIHMIENDWGIADYPLVPGHEGYGTVVKIGSSVKGLKVGDKVGVGWIRDSCGACDNCGCGRENICEAGYQGTYLAGSAAGLWGKNPSNEFGCFSKVMRVEEKFAFKIPETISPLVACPLMCAGGTVFEPIEDYVKPGMTVGVAAIGGLGTLAVKLAKLYGAYVVAFSGSDKKKSAVLEAGADDFVNTKDDVAMAKYAAKVNFILDTCPVNRSVDTFINLLKFDGVYCRVGIPSASDQALNTAWIPIIFTQRKIAGSIVTGSARMKKLIAFSEKHIDFLNKNEASWAASYVPFDQVNEAMKKLANQSGAGYRMVLKW